jgi:Hypoxia induced protein conserved region
MRGAQSGAADEPQCRFRVSQSLNPGYKGAMANFMSHIAVPIAIGAVAIVLLLGLVNMMMGGSGNTSQKLMRLRVLLQAIAIGVIMLTLWFMGK